MDVVRLGLVEEDPVEGFEVCVATVLKQHLSNGNLSAAVHLFKTVNSLKKPILPIPVFCYWMARISILSGDIQTAHRWIESILRGPARCGRQLREKTWLLAVLLKYSLYGQLPRQNELCFGLRHVVELAKRRDSGAAAAAMDALQPHWLRLRIMPLVAQFVAQLRKQEFVWRCRFYIDVQKSNIVDIPKAMEPCVAAMIAEGSLKAYLHRYSTTGRTVAVVSKQNAFPRLEKW